MNTLITTKTLSFANQFDDKNHRYLSWEHCYQYFIDPNVENDKASLHLAFYLASWGMYRGSSFLLWKDYRIHTEVVKKILSVRDYFLNIDFKKSTEEDLKEILALCNFVKNWYTENTGTINGENRNTEPSQILISKILLGTLGCVPAYDRFFLAGLDYQSISPKTLSIKGLSALVDFYRSNSDEFDVLQRKIRIGTTPYPVMKLVDMYFWQIGSDNFSGDKSDSD